MKKNIKKKEYIVSPNDFDDDGKLKPSLFLYLCCAYLCKALFIIIFGVFSRGVDTGGLIESVYSVKSVFYFHLVIGVGTLLFLALLLQRKNLINKDKGVTTNNIYTFLIKYSLVALLLVDVFPLFYEQVLFKSINVLVFGVVVFINVFLLFNYIFSPKEQMFRKEL